MTPVDPITVEVIGNAIASIADEMGEILIRASYSTNIKERRDCSTALFDRQGNTLCQAEHIPLLDHSIDAAYCVNMLDHCERPYEVLDEIHRVLRPGGYLALAVDIGGTPEHPCRLEGPDVSAALSGRYRVLELRCGTEVVTSWPADMQIPAIAFQGQKIDGDISPVAERND